MIARVGAPPPGSSGAGLRSVVGSCGAPRGASRARPPCVRRRRVCCCHRVGRESDGHLSRSGSGSRHRQARPDDRRDPVSGVGCCLARGRGSPRGRGRRGRIPRSPTSDTRVARGSGGVPGGVVRRVGSSRSHDGSRAEDRAPSVEGARRRCDVERRGRPESPRGRRPWLSGERQPTPDSSGGSSYSSPPRG